MLPIFRKLRWQMAKDDQFLKYGRYAFGEIVLVVIGILIALQINNWNEQRQARAEEKRVLRNLHEEFEKNLTLLDSCIATNQMAYNSMLRVMALFGAGSEQAQSVNFDRILFSCFEHKNYFPSQHSLNELTQSGKMQYMRNRRLKLLLYDWSSAFDNMKENYQGVDQKVEYDIIPYLSGHYPMKDMDMHGPLAWKETSRLAKDKFAILQDMEFENLIDDNLYRLRDFLGSLQEMRVLLEEILRESTQYDHLGQ